MSTVRVERCPECNAMIGEGMLHEHQQREHKATKPAQIADLVGRLTVAKTQAEHQCPLHDAEATGEPCRFIAGICQVCGEPESGMCNKPEVTGDRNE